MKSLLESLLESLFDDNISNELPVEKLAKQLRKKDIAKASGNQLIECFDTICSTGTKYTADELKKHPVDLHKNIIVMCFGPKQVNSYNFVFSYEFPNHPAGWQYNTYISGVDRKTKNWVWWWNEYRHLNQLDEWEKKVDSMEHYWVTGSIVFYVLPESISKDLIKCILSK